MSAESNELSSLKSNCAKKPIKKWKLIAAIAVLAIFNVCWGTGESLAVGLLTKYRTKYKTKKLQDKNDTINKKSKGTSSSPGSLREGCLRFRD